MKDALYLDYRRAPRYTWIGKLLLAIGLLTLITSALVYRRLSSTMAMQQAHLLSATTAATSTHAQARLDPRRQGEIQLAIDADRSISWPWESLFQALEATDDLHVAVLSIESNTTPKIVKITAEARDFPAMLNYMKRLQAITLFSQVELLSHHVKADDPRHPIRFVINALWRALS